MTRREKMWILQKIANGNMSCENSDLDSLQIEEVEKLLINEFGEKIEDEHILISWDCWSGIYIMLNPGFDNYESSNSLIERIYQLLIRKWSNKS